MFHIRHLRLTDLSPAVRARFEQNIDRTGTCWLWRGPVNYGGYGHVSIPGKGRHMAHRVSYLLHHGAIPNNLMVLHGCDVRLCVNPAHLYPGTAEDNGLDRLIRGPKVGTDTLSPEAQRWVRELHKDGRTPRKIAELMQVPYTTVLALCSTRDLDWTMS